MPACLHSVEKKTKTADACSAARRGAYEHDRGRRGLHSPGSANFPRIRGVGWVSAGWEGRLGWMSWVLGWVGMGDIRERGRVLSEVYMMVWTCRGFGGDFFFLLLLGGPFVREREHRSFYCAIFPLAFWLGYRFLGIRNQGQSSARFSCFIRNQRGVCLALALPYLPYPAEPQSVAS